MKWISFLVLLFASLSYAGSEDSRKKLLKLVDAYIKLEEKRVEILQKQKVVSNSAQAKSASYTKKKTESDMSVHLQRIEELRKLSQLVETSKDHNLIKRSIETTLDCDLESCLSILGSQNSQLAQQVSDITSHILIKEGKIDDASIDLAFRTWTCNRSIGTWVGDVFMDHRKMSSCMMGIFKKKFPKANISLKGSQEFSAHRTANDFLSLNSKSPELLEKLSARVLASKDYQLSPWELFESCAESSGGDLRRAIDLCYQVVRYNRQRHLFTRKLMDIRGDRPKGGDNSGDWYHFFGMMYKGMTMGSLTPIAYNVYSLLPVVDEVEERSDRAGMNVGLELRRIVKSRENARPFDQKNECSVDQIFHHASP